MDTHCIKGCTLLLSNCQRKGQGAKWGLTLEGANGVAPGGIAGLHFGLGHTEISFSTPR